MRAYVRVKYTGEPCFLAGHCNVVPGTELSLTWREWEVVQANESLDIFEKISEGDERVPPIHPGEPGYGESSAEGIPEGIERVEEVPEGMEDGEVSITDTETGEELDVEDFPVDTEEDEPLEEVESAPAEEPETVEHYEGGELVGMEVTQPDGEVEVFGEVPVDIDYDSLSDGELRVLLTERTDKAPSPRAKRATLIKRLLDLDEIAQGEEE